MHKAIIAVGIATAVCLSAGCGGSSDETVAAASVTRARFIEQAEAICSKAHEDGREARIAWEKANGQEPNFNMAFRRIVGPTLEQEAKELQSLTAPEGEEANLIRIIDNLSKGAAAFTKEGSKPKSTGKFKAFQREARAFGLEACGI